MHLYLNLRFEYRGLGLGSGLLWQENVSEIHKISVSISFSISRYSVKMKNISYVVVVGSAQVCINK